MFSSYLRSQPNMESHWYYYNILQRAWATFAWWASPLTATSRSLIAHMKVSWNQRNIIQALSSISVRCQSWHTRWPWHFCLHVISHCFSCENEIYRSKQLQCPCPPGLWGPGKGPRKTKWVQNSCARQCTLAEAMRKFSKRPTSIPRKKILNSEI